MCSNALPQVRQGLIVAAHSAVGELLDPFSFAPATGQEWLHPALLVERGGPFRGFVATTASTSEVMQQLLMQPCPFLSQVLTHEPTELE